MGLYTSVVQAAWISFRALLCGVTCMRPGVPIPQPLPDMRQNGHLPQTLPAGQVLSTEGATYSWLHSQVQRVYLYASCAEQGNHAAWQPPAGWQLQK